MFIIHSLLLHFFPASFLLSVRIWSIGVCVIVRAISPHLLLNSFSSFNSFFCLFEMVRSLFPFHSSRLLYEVILPSLFLTSFEYFTLLILVRMHQNIGKMYGSIFPSFLLVMLSSIWLYSTFIHLFNAWIFMPRYSFWIARLRMHACTYRLTKNYSWCQWIRVIV